MSHALAICSKVLYDKQILDDKNTIENLQKTIKDLQKLQKKQYMKYKYLELKADFVNVNVRGVLNDLWDSGEIDCSFLPFSIQTNANALAVIFVLCDIQWKYKLKKDIKYYVSYPYCSCTDDDCDIVVTHEEYGNIGIFVGKKFHEAETLEDQKNVYFITYVLDKIIKYSHSGFFEKDTFEFVIQNFVLPYKVKNRAFLSMQNSFEEFLDKNGSFENFFCKKSKEK